MVTETLPPRMRKVKILATLGPASSSAKTIRQLMFAGADAFRINMSHGTHAQKAKLIVAIRSLEKELHRPTTILVDLQGPKLRVGNFEGGSAELEKGDKFTLDRDSALGNSTRVQLPHPELFEAIKAGDRILVDDGKIRLKVAKAAEGKIIAEVVVGGTISDHKGVNVPDVVVPIPALTEKDRKDLKFAIEQRADWIALSFVQRTEDVA
jgi:pyruvate kinase